MKYLENLIELGCFSRQDVVALTGNEQAAHSLLHDHIRAGYIERIRRDLYTAISFETKQPVANRYKISTRIADDACVSFHSAFEYYGFANQVFYEVYVTTKSRFTSFSFDGFSYTRVSPRIDSGVNSTNTGIRITDLERTVIDSIYAFEKIGGLEELLRCLGLIPTLKAEKLKLYLDEYGLANLYQKAGYILKQFSEQLGLSKPFFDYCQSKIPSVKKYLYYQKDNLSRQFILHNDWKLYAPENIHSIISKGVELDG